VVGDQDRDEADGEEVLYVCFGVGREGEGEKGEREKRLSFFFSKKTNGEEDELFRLWFFASNTSSRDTFDRRGAERHSSRVSSHPRFRIR